MARAGRVLPVQRARPPGPTEREHMDFTDTQKELLFGAWGLFHESGSGFVVTDDAFADAYRLEEAGWLESRVEANGDLSWWWTPAAETALALGNLSTTPEGADLN